MKKNIRKCLLSAALALSFGLAGAGLMVGNLPAGVDALDNTNVQDKTGVVWNIVDPDHWSNLYSGTSSFTCTWDTNESSLFYYEFSPSLGNIPVTIHNGDSVFIYPITCVYDVAAGGAVTFSQIVWAFCFDGINNYVFQNYFLPFWVAFHIASDGTGVSVYSAIPLVKVYTDLTGSSFATTSTARVNLNPSVGPWVCAVDEIEGTTGANAVKTLGCAFDWSLCFPMFQRILASFSVFAGDKTLLDNVYNNGYNTGYSQGQNDGYSAGHQDGYVAGQNSVTNDMRTFTSLFGAIVDVPINVLNGLAPMAIWGTPLIYIALSFVFLGVVLWVVKLFI